VPVLSKTPSTNTTSKIEKGTHRETPKEDLPNKSFSRQRVDIVGSGSFGPPAEYRVVQKAEDMGGKPRVSLPKGGSLTSPLCFPSPNCTSKDVPVGEIGITDPLV
jgi:hypothetical protein